ncbi:CCA tRNA nucleotidyltransferase [Corynebacterium sp. 320]|uniref:CCA tRNA nucleotidyltransferase n=1 Tax=Corynebacterium zhongnanshanii TaxID=2768834 RepID=A0ABQ6VBN2_9CORY|nr:MULTISPECIES: CCA tRNA nucleotidyltransferase [Corynebacterium]KAB1502820.1 CCA tRNA nucleotidyltransferase [Corynebacterium sp. 320]KAB1550439.1 CCA tRNA nucleotidyltransferase [Corynebacterium sp. 319]KAB1554830.1 CCA tRNA nucleotidyltransferase [Corynebacterium sp. 321]KAB3519163.1 CCA tRNA nucleotidyltransferase [Corynebacterium zhongnanshanii]KAB3526483.1 CCA tRNA nucleotidyltransferase [Corynebacterium sp. 250]
MKQTQDTQEPTRHTAQPTPTQPTADRPATPAEQLSRAWVALRNQDHTLLPLAAAFAEAGHGLYLVGGSVRDALLGRLSHDLDFTTDARPQQIIDILEPHAETIWDTGIDFGTVSALVNGAMLEITTFRADTYDGESRNPTVQFGDDLDGDLIRRDFRCNAIAVELRPDGDHQIHDPLQGLDDLRAGILDTPTTPQISFNDDPLRMLRACRFVAQLGFDVAPRVRTAMHTMHEQLSRITAERVAVELNKTLLGEQPAQGLELMTETGLADIVLPELPALKMTQDEHFHHKDVYWHSLRVLENAVEQEKKNGWEPDLELRFAALMHDCGKPATRKITDKGGVTFHQHEVVGAKMTRKRLQKLKYSRQLTSDISQLVFLHMRFHGYGQAGNSEWTDSAVRRYVNDAGALLPKLHLLVRADCTTRNERKARRLQRTYDGLEQRIAELQEKENLAAVRPALDGNAIMKILDLTPGPEVGQAWAFLKELALDRGPMSEEDAEAELRAWWAERAG